MLPPATMKCHLLSLPTELHVEILKNMDARSIIAVRLTCKDLRAVTYSGYLWNYLAKEIQSASGVVDILPEAQPDLQRWIARRHYVKDHWSRHPIISSRGTCIVNGLSLRPLMGSLYVYVNAIFPQRMRIVDINHDNIDNRDLYFRPKLNVDCVPRALSYCIDTTKKNLTFLVVTMWSEHGVSHYLCVHTVEAQASSPECRKIHQHSEMTLPALSFGVCRALLITEQYLIRVMYTIKEGARLVLHPRRVEGPYSSEWVSARTSSHVSVFATMLPDDRVLFILLEEIIIYDISPLFALSRLSSHSTPDFENLVLTAWRIPLCVKPTPLPHRNHSIPHISPTSVRFSVIHEDGVLGVEIPHDSTIPHSIINLFLFSSEPVWAAVGVERSAVLYQDGTLETISHEWGGIPTKMSIRNSTTVGYLKFDLISNLVEDIGRVIIRQTQMALVCDICSR